MNVDEIFPPQLCTYQKVLDLFSHWYVKFKLIKTLSLADKTLKQNSQCTDSFLQFFAIDVSKSLDLHKSVGNLKLNTQIFLL